MVILSLLGYFFVNYWKMLSFGFFFFLAKILVLSLSGRDYLVELGRPLFCVLLF